MVELENERLQMALESLRGEVAALRTGIGSGDGRFEDTMSSFGMQPGHSSWVVYSPHSVIYPNGGSQSYAWSEGV